MTRLEAIAWLYEAIENSDLTIFSKTQLTISVSSLNALLRNAGID